MTPRSEHTSEKVAALIAQARSGNHLATRPGLVFDLADALEATIKEMHARELHHFEEEQARAKAEDLLEAERKRAEEARWAAGIVGGVSRDALGALQDAQAERDRLHKAITEALAERMSMGADRILRAALDKEGAEQ